MAKLTNVQLMGYKAAEDYRLANRCKFCGGSLIVEAEKEDFDYGVVECLLCTRPAANVMFRPRKQIDFAKLSSDDSKPKLGRPALVRA